MKKSNTETREFPPLDIFIKDYFAKLLGLIYIMDQESIEKMIMDLWDSYQKEKLVYIIGNGGSAATATHMAFDITNSTVLDRKNPQERRFKTMSITDNTPWITALGNDISFDDIFIEPLKTFLEKDDSVIAISGSGNSPNLIKAIEYAEGKGAHTMALLGFDGGKLKDIVDHYVIVPVRHYGFVEGIHSELHHLIVESLKQLKLAEHEGVEIPKSANGAGKQFKSFTPRMLTETLVSPLSKVNREPGEG